MAKQSSPLYLEMMMKKVVKEKKWEDVDNLLELLNLHHLERPKPFTHGKKCSNCEHRMHCKTIRCPLCHTDMRKRKRQGSEENKIQINENTIENENENETDQEEGVLIDKNSNDNHYDMFASYTDLEKYFLFPVLVIVWVFLKLYYFHRQTTVKTIRCFIIQLWAQSERFGLVEPLLQPLRNCR